jgi:signal peptidase II
MSYSQISKAKPLIGFSLALDILVLDQLSKWLILEYVLKEQVQPNGIRLGLWEWLTKTPPRLPPVSMEVFPFFNLTMVWNEGISFGLFQGSGVWILSAVAMIIVGVFSVWMMRATGWVQTISLGMVIGGAIGNVFDRIRFGGVADFFDFHVMEWHYPAFNVADCAIVVGIALLVFDGLFLEPKRSKKVSL